MTRGGLAVVLGGGAARALAHAGVLEVLAHEDLAPRFVVGSSMGGLIGALWAAGLTPGEIQTLARGFRFPRWFLPGGLVAWERVFGPAAAVLRSCRFETLPRGVAVVAADLESGRRIVLTEGAVLPAVRATCAVPAVLPPEEIGGRWLVDGGLVSLLPVDVAALAAPDAVLAVAVRAGAGRRIPALHGAIARAGWRLGRWAPNPATALLSFELLVRATEIALERQVTLASSMVTPTVLVEIDVGTVGLRDFHRLEEVVAAGRASMTAALPALRAALASAPPATDRLSPAELDPVCDMIVHRDDAPAALDAAGRLRRFCSPGCREVFLQRLTSLDAGAARRGPR